MAYQFEFRVYRRPFKQPLKTHHGNWAVRQGILLKLTDPQGYTGFGEIAPLSWFGSESYEQALQFCRRLPSELTTEAIFAIPDQLPACQFGFESTCEALRLSEAQSQTQNKLTFSALLPSGSAALSRWPELWERGYRTFKWKIGIASFQSELKVFYDLQQQLPCEAQLRLDANGGLTSAETEEWLRVCERSTVEFLEQPLPPAQLEELLALSQRYSTQLALDESVATLAQLEACYQRGWREIFVIKPAIAGSPRRLRQLCNQYKIDAVFSSVFETAIGQQAGLTLAAELSRNDRAVGFGLDHWFMPEDSLSGSNLTSGQPNFPSTAQPQVLWNCL